MFHYMVLLVRVLSPSSRGQSLSVEGGVTGGEISQNEGEFSDLVGRAPASMQWCSSYSRSGGLHPVQGCSSYSSSGVEHRTLAAALS